MGLLSCFRARISELVSFFFAFLYQYSSFFVLFFLLSFFSSALMYD